MTPETASVHVNVAVTAEFRQPAAFDARRQRGGDLRSRGVDLDDDARAAAVGSGYVDDVRPVGETTGVNGARYAASVRRRSTRRRRLSAEPES